MSFERARVTSEYPAHRRRIDAQLVVTENSTLDGVIDMSGGWFDPLAEDVDQSDITVRTLVAAGLVDEFRLFVFPVVVGHGARLFESADARLRLIESRAFRSGAVLLRYATSTP